MRTITTSFFLVLMFQITLAQENFYYYKGEKISLEISTEKIFVKFQEGKTSNEKQQIIFSLISVAEDVINLPDNTAIINIISGLSSTQISDAITNLNNNNNIIVANHFLFYSDSTLQGITEQFVVKLHSSLDYSELETLATQTNTKIIQQNQFDPSIYYLLAGKNANGNSLEMANYFHESGKFEFSEPIFCKIMKPLSFSRNYIKRNTFTSSPPPIELLTFNLTALVSQNAVQITWSTATEINNNFFTIERSTDGVNFTSIGTVQGSGNSSTVKNYSFIDNSLVNGTIFYRLKQTDFDGTTKTFSPQSINVCLPLGNISSPSSNVPCVTPNDQFFSDQWALKNTGQSGGTSGADIKGCQAWSLSSGRDVIRVAVIDEGVDLNHPDLINNLVLGFDATGQGSNGAPQANDAHGTACSGVIAAKGNNNLGVIGIAHNCRIVPVRIAYGCGINCWTTNDTWIANGINWAWNPNFGNADVLSNSWGGGSPSSQITSAIVNAVTNGRGGLGCPVLFASGNSSTSSVSYPASIPEVIAVGATTRNDTRATFSQYGSDIDMVAPGKEIATLDISGTAGYSTIGSQVNVTTYNDDYVSKIDGTSFACPYAAGTMALILSINRCLTQTEARQILELSCDKVGGLGICYVPVAGKPNGTWNNEMGYGRINALKAVQYAFSIQSNSFNNITGSDFCASDNFSFVLLSGGCSQFTDGFYIVKRHLVTTTVSYPFTQSPFVIAQANGFSALSPNSGNFFVQVTNISPTSVTLATCVYEVMSTIQGQSHSWIPTSPANIRFDFAVLSSMEYDLYFQNQTISTGTEIHNAMNKIEMGRNVTNSVPVGDYIIEGDANITFHAGNVGIMKPGTIIRPGPGGFVRMYVDPFFTCTQYPMGKMANSDGSFLPVIKDYEVSKLDTVSALNEKENLVLKIFPNPSPDNAIIEYSISKSELIEITIHDNCGRPLYKLKNKTSHEAGTYQIKLTGINLPSGIYYCIIQSDNYLKTKELVIAK